MKSVSTMLQAHLAGELTTLAELIKITRTDGTVVAFTTHDAALTVGDVTYESDGAFSAGKLIQSSNFKDDAYDVSGLLASDQMSEEDLQNGLYDFARIDIYLCNWADLTQGVLQLQRGWIGEVVLQDGRYAARLNGLKALLAMKVGETYTPECRFVLGDGRCGVALSALSVTGRVTSVTDAQTFGDYTRSEEAGSFNDAILTWTSGANKNIQAEIYKWDLDAQMFTLWLPMTHAVAVGDTYTVAPGCDKRFTTCRKRFSNGAHYGGFPYLPGIGKILDYPDAR